MAPPHVLLRSLALLPGILVMTHTATADAQAPAATTRAAEPIRYTVSFPAPHTHYAEVTAIVPPRAGPRSS